MLLPLLYMLVLLQVPGITQGIWPGVDAHPAPVNFSGPPVTAIEEKAIRAVLKRDTHVWQCAVEDPEGEWIEKLRFQRLALASGAQTVLVQAGPGCARGGQGSNGAMWIVQLQADRVTVLASPAEQFGGWLYSVQALQSKGYHDIVLGWRMSASEASLNYFRFDGRQYKSLGTATIRWNESQHAVIIPDPQR